MTNSIFKNFAIVLLTISVIGFNADIKGQTVGNDASVVYFTKDISSEGLMKVYLALGLTPAEGQKVAVKVSTGEPPSSNYLRQQLIAPMVQSFNGTYVECMTAYGGQRANIAQAKQVATDHGFTPFDLWDEAGSVNIPTPTGSNHLTYDVVGSHINNYSFFVTLSHFKGHAMAGFGGAIKNLSIGCATQAGKCLIHTAGSSTTSPWGGAQNPFQESMAEAAGAVINHFGDSIIHINVMNRLSVDCDCNGHPAEPDMHDIGILASLDPVALDKACVDFVYAVTDGTAQSLIRRIEQLNGILMIAHAEAIGLGSQQYQLVNLDENETSIINIEDDANDSYRIYPNPVGDYVKVTGDFKQLTLYNESGAKVVETKENIVRFNHLPAGVYFLEIQGISKEMVVKKIIKK